MNERADVCHTVILIFIVFSKVSTLHISLSVTEKAKLTHGILSFNEKCLTNRI